MSIEPKQKLKLFIRSAATHLDLNIGLSSIRSACDRMYMNRN